MLTIRDFWEVLNLPKGSRERRLQALLLEAANILAVNFDGGPLERLADYCLHFRDESEQHQFTEAMRAVGFTFRVEYRSARPAIGRKSLPPDRYVVFIPTRNQQEAAA